MKADTEDRRLSKTQVVESQRELAAIVNDRITTGMILFHLPIISDLHSCPFKLVKKINIFGNATADRLLSLCHSRMLSISAQT